MRKRVGVPFAMEMVSVLRYGSDEARAVGVVSCPSVAVRNRAPVRLSFAGPPYNRSRRNGLLAVQLDGITLAGPSLFDGIADKHETVRRAA